MIQSIDSLNQMSLNAIHRLFTHLDPPEDSSLTGIFRGIFVGPGWLRQIWGPLLAVTGLGGCSMGANSQQGVIDTDHQVFVYPGLYVMDGSAISANVGVNPSLTITAMAERAIHLMPAHP